MKLNIVPARSGFLWFRLGIRTFLRQPLALAGLFFMYSALGSLLWLVPLLGPVIALGIVPATTLGFMAATQEAAEGRFPTPKVFLSAFRAGKQRLRAMLMLGLLYDLCCLAIVVIVSLAVDLPAPKQPVTAEDLVSAEVVKALLLSTFLYTPVSVMFWHAPALVHWHGVPPVKSLFFSTVACWRNGRAFLLYGLAWLSVGILAVAIIGAIAAATASPAVVMVVLPPAFMVITAMFLASQYFTFRDSFVASEEQP